MKFVQEYCSICRQETAMPVVQEDEGQGGLIWVQCPLCKEIKPLDVPRPRRSSSPSDSPSTTPRKEEASAARRTIRHYRAGERFQVGEWIYHQEWDDTGEVIASFRSQGGRAVIVVEFQKSGTKRLVVNFVS